MEGILALSSCSWHYIFNHVFYFGECICLHSLQHPEWSLEVSIRLYYSLVKHPPIASHYTQNKSPSPYQGPQGPSPHGTGWTPTSSSTHLSLVLPCRSTHQALSCLHTHHPLFVPSYLQRLDPAHSIIGLNAASSKRPSPTPLSALGTIILYHTISFHFFIALNIFVKLVFCLSSYLKYMLRKWGDFEYDVRPVSPAPRTVPGTC